MKKLLLLSALIVSLFASAQVYDVPVKAGDTVTVRKNNANILFTIPATGLDSAFKFTLQKFQSVPVTPPPPADTLRIVASSSKSGTGTLTHTVIAPSGSVIVILTGFSGSGQNCTIGGSASLSWSKNADAQGSNSGDAEIYTSSVSTAGTYTITTAFTGGPQSSQVLVVTGCEGVGAKAVAIAQAVPSVSITTTKSNSLLLMISADFNGRDGSARVYRDGATNIMYFRAGDKSGTTYTYSKAAATIRQYTEGLSAPSAMAAGTAIIELKSRSGTSVVDTTSPSAPSLNVTSSTTTSIDVSWTTSIDNTSVAGYDVYVDGKLKASTSQISYSVTGLSASTQYNIYVLAKDGYGNTVASNTVTASTLTPANQAPVANAGADASLVLPTNSTTLSGSGSKDADGSIVFYNWSYLSGPSQWFLGNADQMSTTLTNLVQGTYVFRLKVTDDKGALGVDDITINVAAAVPIDTSSSALMGFGADAVGGSKSTTLYHVTNLNSSGAGSLAAGIGSNKTIVFDVSGTIIGRFDLVNISYLTIDATGQDITINNNINGDGISFDGANTHHCILKGVHVTNAGGDGINVINGSHDIMITNCTSWGNRDGNIDIAGDNTGLTKNVTVQWCIMGGGAPNDGSYSGCMLITGQNVSSHHNLYVPATVGGVGERCPLVHCNYSPVGNPNADLRNNLIWKFGRDNGTGSGFGIDIAYGAVGNAINNYVYTTGGSSDNGVTISAYGEPKGNMYASGNVSGNGVNANAQSNHAVYAIPAQYSVTTQTACVAAKLVLASAGPQPRNAVDNGFVSGVTLPGCPAQ